MDPLDAARGTLPWWVPLAPALIRLSLAALLVLGSTLLSGGLALRAMDKLDAGGELHWTERARQLFPWRVALTTWPVLTAVVLAGLAYLVGPLARPAAALIALLTLITGIVLSLPVRLRVEQRARRLNAPFGPMLRSTLLWSFARLPHIWALIVLTLLAPARLDHVTWSLLAVAAGVMLLPAAGGHLWPGRWLGFVRPGSPRLAALIADASARTGVPVRSVIELRTSVANALAFPTTGTIAFTTGALESLDDAQIVAVAAHELGHLKEPLFLRILRGASPLSLAPLVLVRPLLATQRFEILAGVLVGIAAFLYALRFAIRNTEKHADAVAQGAQSDAGVYASALETLYRVNLVPAVLKTRRTAHPHLYDRLVAAGVQPPYPRPAPPPGIPFLARLSGTLSVFAALGLTMLLLVIASTLREGTPDERRLITSIALDGGDAPTFLGLSSLHADRGDHAGAILFARAAVAADPRAPEARHALVLTLVASGRCRDAERALHAWHHDDGEDWAEPRQLVATCREHPSPSQP